MEFITIGVVVNTHGLRGTLKIKSFTDFKEERYKKGTTLYIAFRDELIPVTVEKFRTQKTIELIDFKEFNHINDSEKYKGSEIKIDKALIHDLEDEDEFYFQELIGMDVWTDKAVGKCIDIREVPQGELLIVERKGLKNALIPFNKHFVKDVDKNNNRIILLEWEGLL